MLKQLWKGNAKASALRKYQRQVNNNEHVITQGKSTMEQQINNGTLYLESYLIIQNTFLL
jgi:hypothetical protein